MGQFRANDGGNGRMAEWESGLPTGSDLPPLYQLLIPEGLASAFQISPHQNSTVADVDRASATTFSSLQDGGVAHATSPDTADEDITGPGSMEPMTAAAAVEVEEDDGEPVAARKRQRLVWTPELQRRFLDVVERLGVKNAVPKMIMQMMNVEGLSRENVASHLQKYRIYVKQRQRFSGGDATSSPSGRFPQVGPMAMEVPGLGHNSTQGCHHYHHHHHHYHHNHDDSYVHGHDAAIGFGSNQNTTEQNGSGGGSNDMEEESIRL